MKRNNKKGFTLAELLIVVAIIAVLVAVAIPVFTGATNKAEDAKDVANVRSYIAEQTVAQMVANNWDGTVSISAAAINALCTEGHIVATAGSNTVTVTAGSATQTYTIDDGVTVTA
jgi:prepilin-type N-terminal cleavage/methylation domain-containing protein